MSWRILLDDLHAGFRQAATGAPVRLAPATTPISAWSRALGELAHSPETEADLDFWLSQTSVDPAGPEPDLPHPPEHAREADTEQTTVGLDAEDTRLLLREVPRAYRTHIDDVLLTALTMALTRSTLSDHASLWLEGHGREQHLVDGADLSRTLGWFTSIAPVRLTLPPGDDPEAALKAVKEQLRAVPHHGLSYGLLRYLHAVHASTLAARPRPASASTTWGSSTPPSPARTRNRAAMTDRRCGCGGHRNRCRPPSTRRTRARTCSTSTRSPSTGIWTSPSPTARRITAPGRSSGSPRRPSRASAD
ncbi:condensation domain-containing protein [Actinomadura luteofluorescens]|uniref:condensation domain-containing protein n=1 Tax=Actinomadura luteofluorescens TaxID=46163 RepID=UPI003630D96A